MRIHLLSEPPPARRAAIERILGSWHQLVVGPLSSPTDILVAGRFDAQQLELVQSTLVVPFSGLPPQSRALLLNRPTLAVYNLHHNAQAVAELGAGLVLAAAKLLLPMDRALRAGDWRPRYGVDPGIALEGKRAVVLGYGAIGRRVGRALTGLGMEVTGVCRRHPEPGVVTAEHLDQALSGATVLVCCLPLTPGTQGMVDARRLALLADPAVVANLGRAEVIEEDALFAACQRGLRAGLDVWYRYPSASEVGSTYPSKHPFHELDGVVLSPHRAGHGPEVEVARTRALVQTLSVLLEGGTPAGRVDVWAGY